ncbi:hypothetical protein SAMN04488524_3195 [Pedobacter africanus]|uniref:Uncharacterized protein n=1 Tax=Pedobacter africanus TaxID=151894 RepID=A0A1W2CTD4_9SPHI|nr:hypothetical protein SAMN04488524_3195 [Pedobacter africanus]
MVQKVILHRRSKAPLVVIETLFSSGFLAYWLFKKYEFDWLLGVVIFIASFLLTAFLFFNIRIFRYIYSILFSLGWGFLGYIFASSVTKSDLTAWVVLAAVFVLSLLVHKSYFSFETNAERIDYR